MKQVILTADDYGLCEPVNTAIDECLALGTLSSACVMTNMPSCAAVSGLRRRFPQASLGLHWTLTQGRPVLPRERVPSLVAPSGWFLPAGELRRQWRLGRLRRSELSAELHAQHARFAELAGAPDYWNSHENVHVWPGLFQVFARTGLECGITAMRSHRRVVVARRGSARQWLAWHPVFLLKGLVIDRLSAWAERLSIRMPRGLIYAPGFDKHTEIEPILSSPELVLTAAPAELVVHPSVQVQARLFGVLRDSRLREYQTLRDARMPGRLLKAGVQLVTFSAITPRSDAA